MGWSSWNHFGNTLGNVGSHCHCPLGAQGLMEIADALVASGLRDKGYRYVNQDGGWAIGRDNVTGELVPDPAQFPDGVKMVADYIHSKGLLFGLYTDRGSSNCGGMQTGSDAHEAIDARQWAGWGVDLIKDDSCGGQTHGTVWEQYARMRDALNATGRPIWYMITQMVDYDDGWDSMHCIKGSRAMGRVGTTPGRWGAFTTRPWVYEGRDPADLANSFLAEYCNNKVPFGATGQAGGFLSQLDAQQLLTWDNLTRPGAFNDMDMLEVCNTDHGVTPTLQEARSQFSTFAILTSPLILGNDPRNMSAACLEVIGNAEVIALNQDPRVSRARLVFQWPDAAWPGAEKVPANGSGYPDLDPNGTRTLHAVWPARAAEQVPPHIIVQAWAKPLADGSFGVVVFNRGAPAAQEVAIDWAWLGLRPTAAASVRDLWRHAELGSFGGSGGRTLNVTVGPRDVVVLQIRPTRHF